VLIVITVCLHLIPSTPIISVAIVENLEVALASILTSRLVLNLKQASNSHMRHEASTLPSLAFATNSFVGNLGAPFRVSNEDDEDDQIQELGNDEHELQELNREGQGAPILDI